MTITIYSFKLSAPCRAVLMTAKQLGLDYQVVEMHPSRGEQLAPEFVKLNPLHLLPTLVDNGFVLWESRPIMQYLCDTYAPDSDLYPSEPKKRAIVDRWLYFDVALRASIKEGVMWQMLVGQEPDQSKMTTMNNNMKLLDQLIGDNQYVAGDHLTIADLTILANTMSEAMILTKDGFDLDQLPNFKRWYEKLRNQLGYFDEVLLSTTQEEIDDWAKNKEYVKKLLARV